MNPGLCVETVVQDFVDIDTRLIVSSSVCSDIFSAGL